MSPVRIGLAVASLTALLWGIGALSPWHPRDWTALDLHWYFVPSYEAFYRAAAAGAPMLWNPYQLCGMPWLGTLQSGFFYPPHLLYVLLPTPWALASSTVLHLALGAGGTAAFARRAGTSPAGATLAAAVFAFAGMLRSMQLWPYFLETAAWLPIGALAILELTRRPMHGAIGLALASGMSWLAGSPQATVFSCYAWAALLVAGLIVERPRPAALVRALGGFAIGLLAGLLLAAVTLLPSLELAREGVRRTSALGTESMYGFGVPSPRHQWHKWLATGSPVLLLGALCLAPFALLSASRALVAWALALAGITTAFALGPATPLFELYRVLPLLAWFRMPHRVLLVGQLALGMLAGLGLDVAAARLHLRRAAPVVVAGALAAVAIEGIQSPPPVPPLPYRTAAASYSPAHREAYERLATTAGSLRVWPFSPRLAHYALPPKLPTLTRLRAIDDYEPLSLRRQVEYFGFFGEGARWGGGLVVDSLAAPPGQTAAGTRRRLLDLAGVRFMVMPFWTRKRADVDAFVRDAGLEARPPLPGDLALLENPHVLPRAFVTYRASPAPPTAELLSILARESYDPFAESWVEDAAVPAAPGAPARGAPAQIVRDDPQVVEIDATLAVPGLVVLADTFYPGWTATVDGVPAPIFATNHLFRGVPAPAGTHRIRFAYRPRSLALGAALSALTLLALMVAARRSRVPA